MAKVKVVEVKVITLTLGEDEATYLRDSMQNCLAEAGEDLEQQTHRGAIWEALNTELGS